MACKNGSKLFEGVKCASKEEQENFVHDMFFIVRNVQKLTNFKVFDREPTFFRIQDLGGLALKYDFTTLAFLDVKFNLINDMTDRFL